MSDIFEMGGSNARGKMGGPHIVSCAIINEQMLGITPILQGNRHLEYVG